MLRNSNNTIANILSHKSSSSKNWSLLTKSALWSLIGDMARNWPISVSGSTILSGFSIKCDYDYCQAKLNILLRLIGLLYPYPINSIALESEKSSLLLSSNGIYISFLFNFYNLEPSFGESIVYVIAFSTDILFVGIELVALIFLSW